MDAHSISYTSPSYRTSSRIYQDLAKYHSTGHCHQERSTDNFRMVSTFQPRSPLQSRPPKICIVGAGLSGLRCADILLQSGFDVTILEARERVGGRMYQSTLPSGHTVDLGPNWIHGTDHNPILDLVKSTGTPTHTWDGLVNVFGEDAEFLPDGRALGDSMWSIIEAAFKYSAENTSSIDCQASLHEFFRSKVTELFPDSSKSEEQRKIVMQLSELWGAFVGSRVETQSLKFFWLEECIDGENLFCAGTYEKVLSRIAKPALDANIVKYSTKVTRIESSVSSARVFSDEGLEGQFDEVVVTMPLGWLKKNKAAFQPNLPARFSRAIDSIGYGSLEKVFITFPRAFWLHDNSDESKEQFTGFTQWLSPLYASSTNPLRWTQECVDLSTLPEPCAHPTLLFYIFGEQSESLCADLAALPSEKERTEHVIKFFEPYFSLLPHYDASSEDCKPVSCLPTSWVLDEFAGNGSYTTFRTGLEQGDKDIEVMREGLPDRRLWFAGEHTAPFVALGTATGAYWSGEGVGKRIGEAYQMTDGNNGRINVDGILASGNNVKDPNMRGFEGRALEK